MEENKNIQAAVLEMMELMREAARREILPRWGKVIQRDKTTAHQFEDLVTEADLNASMYILDRVRKKYPGSYSEEHKYPDRFEHERIWQIDPVDGTQEFCEGYLDGYACHAALLEKRSDGTYFPVAGIIYQPAGDKFWFTDASGGPLCRIGGREISIAPSLKNKLYGCIRRVDPDYSLKEFYASLGVTLQLPVEIVPLGGAGASIIALLEGRTNLIIMHYNYSKEWDLAMAEPIIKAAGGFICDLEGNPFLYNREDEPGLGEPYNLKGYVISIAFNKEEIIPLIPESLLVDRLNLP